MVCKFCKTKPAWKFTNQRTLCRSHFIEYFEKKVLSTIRKYKMPTDKIDSNSLKAKIINNLIANLLTRKGKLSTDSLDNVSNNILYIIMYENKNKLKNFLPSNQPLYFLSDKEILLYSKIKNIRGRLEKPKGKLREINNFINDIEKKNPDIRHNIVTALLSQNLL